MNFAAVDGIDRGLADVDADDFFLERSKYGGGWQADVAEAYDGNGIKFHGVGR
ncbi:hypothetical protein D3C81_1992900 [compost metagenome]